MKITCDVIEDLLPLYVDDVASGDSRTLIEEHLNECESCRKTLEDMRKDIDILHSDNDEIGQNDKMIILRLKKKIMKRIAAVIVVAVILVMLVCVGNYFYHDYNVYVDYEDSGVYVENNILYGIRQTGGVCMMESSDGTDGKIAFFYLLDSPFDHDESNGSDDRIRIIMDMNLTWPDGAEAIVTDEEEAEEFREKGITDFAVLPEITIPENVDRLYYIEKDQIKNIDNANELFRKGKDENAEELVRIAKENSVLLWERK